LTWINSEDFEKNKIDCAGIYISRDGTAHNRGYGKDEKKYSWISKLDKDGNELWTTDYSGYSYGVKFAVREDGAFYVLGTETDKNNNSNLWVRKYIQYSEK